MAANGHITGNSPALGDVASWGSKLPPFNPAGLVSVSESTPPEASTGGDSTKSSRGNASRPNNVAMAVPMPAANGKKSVRKRSGYPRSLDPPAAAAGAGAGRPNANKNDQVGDIEVEAERCDQPNALRAILLEAEIRSARFLNVQLQQQMVFLETQIRVQHQQITGLHDKVKALETELKSAKVSAVAQAKPVLPNYLGADTVSVDPSSQPGSTQTVAVDTSLQTSSEQDKLETTALESPALVSNAFSYDFSHGDACGSAMAPAAEAAAGQGGSGVTPPGSKVPVPGREVAPHTQATEEQASIPAVISPTTNTDREAVSLAGSGSTNLSFSGSSDAAIAQRSKGANDGSDVAVESVPKGGPVLDAGVIGSPAIKTPRKRRHSLMDFWTGSSSSITLDDTPPASNTRRHRHATRQQQRQGASAGQVMEQATSHLAAAPSPLQDQAACANMTEGRETIPMLDAAATAAPSERVDPVSYTDPMTPNANPLVLRRAMEGREGAEGRSGHLMDCASCQDALPGGDSIGRCDGCPRSFCAQCLERGLREQEVELEGMDPESRALLNGTQGDFFIARCPKCLSGKDRELSPPPQGTAPMDHLLGELLRHDLSLCFREPVDIVKHPDYVESIGRNAMMDLGTMSRKLKERRYPRRRGPGQFLEDLNRVWRNCRRYAGCDELGKPHFGNIVPGIVRCALTLEALTLKYCAAHMSDNEGSASWQESTWDFYRQEQERANATARLNQLGGFVRSFDKAGTKTPSNGGRTERLAPPPSEGAVGTTGVEPSGEEQDNESGRGSTESPQQATTTSPTAGGRKRSAATMEEVAGASVQLGRSRRTGRILLDVTDANSGSAGGASPKTGNRRVKKDHQQSPWSPLDRLCDLATTYIS